MEWGHCSSETECQETPSGANTLYHYFCGRLRQEDPVNPGLHSEILFQRINK